jgi:Na+/proline symporter
MNMTLSILDWLVIVAYFLLSMGIIWYYRNKGKDSLEDYFVGGRNMPWYLAGLSMVATTFAADTPLAVTELVVKDGISGNWLWWNMLIGGMLTAFFFAKLWRRAGVVTEPELIELRYHGKPAAFLRGFKAVYLGLFMNVLVIGWVNLAMLGLLQVFFGLSYFDALMYVGIIMLFTAIYSSISGLWGIAATDAAQFTIAMAGCIILAIIVLNQPEIGGLVGLQEKLPSSALRFFPQFGGADGSGTLSITIGAFAAFAGVQWWASWYPGAEPGGGGYIVQRMLSARSENDAFKATLFFQVAHFCLRPWPWIIVALCCTILYPQILEPRLGYVYAMRDFLPSGLRGLLLVAFFAAYMSTISTQLNWGASYLVNDFYKRFFIKSKENEDRNMVAAGRIFTLVIMLIALYATTLMTSIAGVWKFLIECGAGLGLVLILRWYWWRINVWSEIVATVSPFIFYFLFRHLASNGYFPAWFEAQNITYFLTVGCTTTAWIVATYLTPPEPDAHLAAFYKQVKPGGFWKDFKTDDNNKPLIWTVFSWLLAVVFTYSCLFLSGKILFGETNEIIIYGLTAGVSLLLLQSCMKRSSV